MKIALFLKFALIGGFLSLSSGTALGQIAQYSQIEYTHAADGVVGGAAVKTNVGAGNTNVCVCTAAKGCNASGHWFQIGTHFGATISQATASAAGVKGTGWLCYKPTNPGKTLTRGSDSKLHMACTCVGKSEASGQDYCGPSSQAESRQILSGAPVDFRQGLAVTDVEKAYVPQTNGVTSKTGWLCGWHLGDEQTFLNKAQNFDKSVNKTPAK